jgi:hypothetical protein
VDGNVRAVPDRSFSPAKREREVIRLYAEKEAVVVNSKQAAIAVLIGLMFKGKVPPYIWDEPLMSRIYEWDWGKSQDSMSGASYRRRILDRTAEFRTPYYRVRMHLQASQYERNSHLSTPIWVVCRVELLASNLGLETIVETIGEKYLARQAWIDGRASIAPLVEEAKGVFQP